MLTKYTSMPEFLEDLESAIERYEREEKEREFLEYLESALENERWEKERIAHISQEERVRKREALIMDRKEIEHQERKALEERESAIEKYEEGKGMRRKVKKRSGVSPKEALGDLFKQNDNLNDLSGILHFYGGVIFSYSTMFDHALILSKEDYVPKKARRKYKNSVKDYKKARDLWFAAEDEKSGGRFEEAKKLYIESLQKEEQASNSYFDAIDTEIDEINKRIKKLKGN